MPQQPKASETMIALKLATELGYIIALPLVVLGFSGALMDKKYGTSPLFLLIGIVLSLILTSIGLYRKITNILKTINSTPISKPTSKSPENNE